MIGVLYNATDAYVHYCLSHEPKGKELQPVLDEADIDD